MDKIYISIISMDKIGYCLYSPMDKIYISIISMDKIGYCLYSPMDKIGYFYNFHG